jgi:hypothetical protein
MRRFLEEEAGTRRTLWYPETAYWCSVDIDVPLFLPVYAQRRVHDARLLAQDEAAGRVGRGAHAGTRLDGQMIFSSGWEWGYWLNDVVAARLAWDPQAAAATDDEAVRRALAPVVRPFGAAAPAVTDLLVRCMEEQGDLLILGKVGGVAPASVEKRNGLAYLQGWETWDEVSATLGLVPGVTPSLTQPAKLGMLDMSSPLGVLTGGPDYRTEVAPLLDEMDRRFMATADDLRAVAPQAPAASRPLLDELADAARMTGLRARQVHGLYDYVDTSARARLATARAALDEAATIVTRREAAYRVPADRIAGWRPNPTCYRFGYLWTARSLFYWWRDEGKAVDRPWSPAYLNIFDPIDVAFGEGAWQPLADAARAFGQRFGASSVTDLLAAPASEPTFPQLNLRSRP